MGEVGNLGVPGRGSGIWGSRDRDRGEAVCPRAAGGDLGDPEKGSPAGGPEGRGGARGADRDCGAAGGHSGPGRSRAAGRARALQEAPPRRPRLSRLFEKGKARRATPTAAGALPYAQSPTRLPKLLSATPSPARVAVRLQPLLFKREAGIPPQPPSLSFLPRLEFPTQD